MRIKTIKLIEGNTKLIVPDPSKYKLSAKAPVFYNPAMAVNRDLSVLLLEALKPKAKSAVDLLCATGAKGLRIKKEVKVKDVYLNDANPDATRLAKRNSKLNRLSVHIYKKRAHEFLATRYKMKHKKFDYLDIDPFGTPVPFLDAGIKAITENGGIIAVTATDTSVLCGTYPDACVRKYGSRPMYNYLMNEIGLRILIKKVQEIGAQYDLALKPIFAHTTRHYMRCFLKSEKGKEQTNEVLRQIGPYYGAGPMWLGPLYDAGLVENMYKIAVLSKYAETGKYDNKKMQETAHRLGQLWPTDFSGIKISDQTASLLYVIREESSIARVGFYDLAQYKLKQVPKVYEIVARLQQKGFKAARTHFSNTGIKTDASEKDFLAVLKK